jgi:hypothetical protein
VGVVAAVVVAGLLAYFLQNTSHILQNIFILLFINSPEMTGHRGRASLKPNNAHVIVYVRTTIWKHPFKIIQ